MKTELLPIQQKTLNHIGRYRLSVRPVLEKFLFEGRAKPCDNTLENLKKKGLVEVRRRAFGRHSYYQLTPTGTDAAEVPESRSDPLGPESLARHLAILAFCFLGDKQRTRMERHELAHAKLFGFEAKGDYCFEPEGRKFVTGEFLPRIYRIHVLNSSSRLDYCVRRIRENQVTAQERESLQPFLTLKLFGSAILTGCDEDTRRTKARVRKERLAEAACIEVMTVPTPQTYESMINNLPTS